MINPKAHEVVERLVQAEYVKFCAEGKPNYGDDTDGHADRELLRRGIRLALEMEEVAHMRNVLEHHHCEANEPCDWCKAIDNFDALKLLHVPSGEG